MDFFEKWLNACTTPKNGLRGQLYPLRAVSGGGLFRTTCTGNALLSINKVALRLARLVAGWATALWQVNHLAVDPATQAKLSLAIPRR